MAGVSEQQILDSLKKVIDPDSGKDIAGAGMIQGLIHDIPTCRELIDRIVADAPAIVNTRLSGMLAG